MRGGGSLASCYRHPEHVYHPPRQGNFLRRVRWPSHSKNIPVGEMESWVLWASCGASNCVCPGGDKIQIAVLMQLISPAGVEAELAMFYACPSSIAKMFEHARNDGNKRQ